MQVRIFVVALCAGLFVAIGGSSLADRTAFGDQNDAYGPLDVRKMIHGHGEGDLVHRVVTYGKWDRKTLNNEDSEILLLFTTDSDNKPERVLVVDAQGKRIVAEMRKWNNGPGEKVVGEGDVTRPSEREIKIAFAKSLLGKKVTEYGWHVDTRFHDPDHSKCNFSEDVLVVCPDSAPNTNTPRAYLRHEVV